MIIIEVERQGVIYITGGRFVRVITLLVIRQRSDYIKDGKAKK